MSNVSGDGIAKSSRGWTARHLEIYVQSGGVRGHILDLREVGGHRFTTTLLLRTIGRKSGTGRIVPLIYGNLGGEVAVIASKGGAPAHPAWYLNLKEGEQADFQIATEAFHATWREPQGAERQTIWEFMLGIYPRYNEYQGRTGREIPLILLSALDPIEAFTA